MLQRSLVLITALLALTLYSVPSYAASTLAVVNVQKIMQEAKAADAIRSQMKAKQKSFQEELDKREKELQKEDQDLAKQRSVLSQEAFEKKYQEFRKKAADAQKEVRTKRAALDKGFSQALAEIQKKVTEIVASIAEKSNVDAVISTNQMLYAAQSLDITAEVLTQLNSQMPNVNVNFN